MYRFTKKIVLLFALTLNTTMLLQAQTKNATWDLLPPIPDSLGFAGSYAGTVGHAIIYAGGAQFKGGVPPWSGGQKMWTDNVYIFSDQQNAWKQVGKLPRPLGYGASASYGKNFFLAAGSDPQKHYRNTYQLSYDSEGLHIRELAPLPVALANVAFAQHKNYWYILGGQDDPQAGHASNRVFRLDLANPETGWEELPAFPGDGRILAAAAASDSGLYIFSGASLTGGKRTYLISGFHFDGKSWSKTAELPASITAAANPGIALKENEFLFFSGDDGSLASADLRDKHPGFSRKMLTYFAQQDRWEHTATIPNAPSSPSAADLPPIGAPVTTTALQWQGYIVIPGGEVRPAVRTNQVLRYKP